MVLAYILSNLFIYLFLNVTKVFSNTQPFFHTICGKLSAKSKVPQTSEFTKCNQTATKQEMF
jgi:hypothetical protein